ncbi:retinoic acid receptor RXR-alpha-B [Hydra vulgaris]|uniref:Retinoic acid receptor RXR-alpha-B n=1 Tax=Hydra vulgaris TaxID=6087 RepID=A0ABM4BFV2_HYDVU
MLSQSSVGSVEGSFLNDCKAENLKNLFSVRPIHASESFDCFSSAEKLRGKLQREFLNNSTTSNLVTSNSPIYHPKEYIYNKNNSASPFKSYINNNNNNNTIYFSRRSFNPYYLEKHEYNHPEYNPPEDFYVEKVHKYSKEMSPTFNFNRIPSQNNANFQTYNKPRLMGSMSPPHLQSHSSNNNRYAPNPNHSDNYGFRKQNGSCAVCADKLSSYFHGAIICVSCQGFFKRALKNGRKYTCYAQRKCSLNKKTRNHCQACRLAACFKVGVKKDGVLEEICFEKEQKMAQKSVKKKNKELLPSSSSIDLKSIYDAERFAHPHISNVTEIKANVIHHLCQSIDKQLVSLAEWARRLPCFEDLNITDQIKVLQSNWSELLIGALCFRSLTSNGLMLETGLYVSRGSIQDNSIETTLTRTFDKVLDRMKDLQIDMTEWGCLRAVILFNPDTNSLGAVDQVDEIRERYLLTLIDYCKLIFPNENNRFSRLLLCLPRIKSLAIEVLEILKYSKLIMNSSIDSFICDILANK